MNSSHAVISHSDGLPSAPTLRKLRKYVDEQQIWIWFNQESPINARNMQPYHGIFNWSATYSTKSDVFVPYAETRLSTPFTNA